MGHDKDHVEGEKPKAAPKTETEEKENSAIHDVARGTKDTDVELGIPAKDDRAKINEDGGRDNA